MQIVVHATEIIDGKTYITENYTVEADRCRTPEGAEALMVDFLPRADDTFNKIREARHRKSATNST